MNESHMSLSESESIEHNGPVPVYQRPESIVYGAFSLVMASEFVAEIVTAASTGLTDFEALGAISSLPVSIFAGYNAVVAHRETVAYKNATEEERNSPKVLDRRYFVRSMRTIGWAGSALLCGEIGLLEAVKIPVRNDTFAKLMSFLGNVVQKSFKALLIIGSLFYLIKIVKRSEKQSENIIFFSLASAFLVATLAILLLPSLSEFYNFERLYEQALPILGIVIVVGAITLAKLTKVKINYVTPILLVLTIFYFLGYSGFLTEIVGGSPTMQLANQGDAYNRFYTHDGEILAINWMSRERSANEPIAADNYGSVRLRRVYAPSVNISTDITQAALNSKSLLLATYANIHYGIAYDQYENNVVVYNFPQKLIQSNKALIYTNNQSQIYK